ncbi:D-arabinitol dehydrogenase 1-like isoform X2 [Agrilus planipennis]|uniref:D-arabinitol dehydrogenase 1-like isoform X2 n=1 Tax=Agrilus planipennis TaxID=224129 RepID=A0A1W4XMI5_AGRPL|nr:D-arabinitol dehydrogenase 1-like isoform X2 [Agrilus planipennis]
MVTTSNDNEVLIKVAYAGICGTDLHIVQGAFPCNGVSPFILGHEFSGILEAKGRNVKWLQIGDRVAVDPNRSCNICNYCREGNVNYCKNGGINNTLGIVRDGGWAEYVSVPSDEVYKLPDCITLEQAVLLEPLSCIAHAWSKIMPIRPGQKVLVLGAGIIGNLFACVLHSQGHRDVIVSEPVGSRRNLLNNLDTGFECVTPAKLKLKNNLFDVIIDTTGYAPAVEEAIYLLDFGGKVCLFGCANPEAKISIPAFDITAKEIQLFGVFLNPLSFTKAVGLMKSMGQRYFDFEKLGIKTYSLSNYKEALATLKDGTISKAVFRI